MDIDKLVDKIVEEVLKRVAEVEAKEIHQTREEELSEYKKKLKKSVLITERPDSTRYKEVCSLINSEDYDIFSLKDYHSGKKDYCMIIIGSMLNRELANLSVGVQCGDLENIVLEALFNGERVLLLKEGIEYRDYKNSINPNLYKLYENHEKNIISFGVELITLEKLSSSLNEVKQDANQHEKESISCCEMELNKILEAADLTDKKVITEAELRRVLGRNKKRIIVNSKTIITPLCRDFLKKSEISVEIK